MSAQKAYTLLLSALLVGTAVRADEPSSGTVQMLLANGKDWYAKGEWDKACKAYDEAIRLDPKSGEAFEGRATVRLRQQEWDKAIKDFDAAIRLKPRLASAFSNRGVAWQMKGDSDKAMADYNEAVKLHPFYAPAYLNRGLILAERGELDAAIDEFNKAIVCDKKFVDALIDRANAWLSKAEYEKALKDYDAGLALDPKSLRGLGHRAWLRATCPVDKLRDGAKAVADAKNGSALPGGDNPYHFAIRAAAHAEAGEFDEAVRWQKKALADAAYARRYGDSARDRLKLYEAKKPFRLSN